MLHIRIPFKSKRQRANVRKSHPHLHHDTSQPPDTQPTVTVGSLLCVCIVYQLNRSSQLTIHTQHCAARRKGKRHGPNCWPCFAMANGDPVKRNLERNESAPHRIKKTIKASCHCVDGRFQVALLIVWNSGACTQGDSYFQVLALCGEDWLTPLI
jgi:hypothetical protein